MEKERESEGERERKREKERERDVLYKERLTAGKKKRWKERQSERVVYRRAGKRLKSINTGRESERWRERNKERERQRDTGRQIEVMLMLIKKCNLTILLPWILSLNLPCSTKKKLVNQIGFNVKRKKIRPEGKHSIMRLNYSFSCCFSQGTLN